MWHKLIIKHSQKDSVEIYCREVDTINGISVKNIFPSELIDSGKVVEVAAVGLYKAKKTILYRELFSGSLDQLSFDQNKTKIPWVLEQFDPEALPVNNNWIPNRIKQKALLSIKQGIVNTIAIAIDDTISNRGFSRFVKKNIIGRWVYKDISISFLDKERFETSGSVSEHQFLKLLPKQGFWGVSTNVMYMLDDNSTGIKLQIVDIVDNKLYFLGYEGVIFYILNKSTN
jgi:hypothetical protein